MREVQEAAALLLFLARLFRVTPARELCTAGAAMLSPTATVTPPAGLVREAVEIFLLRVWRPYQEARVRQAFASFMSTRN